LRPIRRAVAVAACLIAGAALPSAAGAAETWAASPGHTILPVTTRPATAPAEAVVAAARDEYEGVQVAIRSDVPLTVRPAVGDLAGPAVIPASRIALFRVGYVRLARPSTGVGPLPGDGRMPDPLLPVDAPFTVPAGETTTVYARVHVPADAPAGRNSGALDLGRRGRCRCTSTSPP
jgi:hypothetical protein